MIWIKLFWTFRKQLFSSSTWFNELKAIVFETSKMVSFEPLLNFCILAACTTCKALFIYPFSNTHVPLRSSSLKEVTNIGVAGGGPKRPCPPKFLENIAILCFERRFSKQNSVIRLQSNILPLQKFLAPPSFWAGYATGHEKPQSIKRPTVSSLSEKSKQLLEVI